MMSPRVVPNDVFSPIARVGEKAKGAVGSIGKAINDYNMMNEWLEKKANREKFRKEIIRKYGFPDDFISKDLSKDELGKINNRLRMADDTWQKALNARVNKIGSMPTQQMLRTAAVGASDDYFYKYLGTLGETIVSAEKAQKEEENKQIEEENKTSEEAAINQAGANLPPGTTDTEARKAAAQTTFRKRTPQGYKQSTPGLSTVKEAGMFGDKPTKPADESRDRRDRNKQQNENEKLVLSWTKERNNIVDDLQKLIRLQKTPVSERMKIAIGKGYIEEGSSNEALDEALWDMISSTKNRANDMQKKINKLEGASPNRGLYVIAEREKGGPPAPKPSAAPGPAPAGGRFAPPAGREARKDMGEAERAAKRKAIRAELDKEPIFSGAKGDEAIKMELRQIFAGRGKSFDGLSADQQAEAIRRYKARGK